MTNPTPNLDSQNQALEHVAQAREALRAGQRDDAQQHVNDALESAGDCIPAIELQGVLAGMRGDMDAAAEAFLRVTQTQPDNPGAWFNLAKCQFESGDLDLAQTSLDRVLDLDPTRADVLALQGAVQRATGHPDQAEASLRQAVQQSPDHLAAVTALASLLAEQGQDEAALEWFERAARIQPGVPHTQFNLGQALLRRGQLQEASNALHVALTLDNHFHDARLALADVARLRGDLQEAIGLCRRVVRRRPGHLPAQHRLVGLLLADSRPGELELLLEQSGGAFLNTPWLELWRAQLNARRGHEDAARETLTRLRLSSCPPLDPALVDDELSRLP